MNKPFHSSISLPDFRLFGQTGSTSVPFSFDLEVTARCNLDCRHCYINLPAGDGGARARELPLEAIKDIVDQAAALGSLWCLISGGEPLLRADFADIYKHCKRRGMLISVFTNATLITDEHVELFRTYPPRDIEVTVYGVTEATFERISRRPGSFKLFMRGLERLLETDVKVRLKSVALRSNVHEMQAIADFCRERTKDFYRFDPFIHLRYDGDSRRNEEILAERLTIEEIMALEKEDPERFAEMTDNCDRLIQPEYTGAGCASGEVFNCGAGVGQFTVGYDGLFRLCSDLVHPDCVYDLRQGRLAEAFAEVVPRVRSMHSRRKEFLTRCHTCSIPNLCMWCPARAHLEVGELDLPVEEFCRIAHARAKQLQSAVTEPDAAV